MKKQLALLLIISLIKLLKSKGPITEPCGMRIDIGWILEIVSPICPNASDCTGNL